MKTNIFEQALRQIEQSSIKNFISKNEYLFSEFIYFTDILEINFYHGAHFIYAVKGKVSTVWRDKVDKLFVFEVTDNDGLTIKSFIDDQVETTFEELRQRMIDKGVERVNYINLA